MATWLLLPFITCLSFLQSLSSPTPPSASFLHTLQSQCSLPVSSNSPLLVDGNFIEGVLSSRERAGYISILFYASRWPFSHTMLPEFGILCSIFPQVDHVTLEQSSALPSLFSKYGIHSLPAILLVNQTSSEISRCKQSYLPSRILCEKHWTSYLTKEYPKSLGYYMMFPTFHISHCTTLLFVVCCHVMYTVHLIEKLQKKNGNTHSTFLCVECSPNCSGAIKPLETFSMGK